MSIIGDTIRLGARAVKKVDEYAQGLVGPRPTPTKELRKAVEDARALLNLEHDPGFRLVRKVLNEELNHCNDQLGHCDEKTLVKLQERKRTLNTIDAFIAKKLKDGEVAQAKLDAMEKRDADV